MKRRDNRRPLLTDLLERPATLAGFAPLGAWQAAELLEGDQRPSHWPPTAVASLVEAYRRFAAVVEYTVDGAADRERLRPFLEDIERERLALVVEYGGVIDGRYFHGMAEDADGLPVVVPLRRPPSSGGSR